MPNLFFVEVQGLEVCGFENDLNGHVPFKESNF